MIYKRVAARLRAQDWVAITIEIGIVVIGVFIGTLVSNWNADRLERIETRRMLTQLQPEVRGLIDFSTSTRDYYKITRRYAGIALAGWKRDRTVDDRAFVIAVYQASQISGSATNNSTWATIFGAERLRTIEDPQFVAACPRSCQSTPAKSVFWPSTRRIGRMSDASFRLKFRTQSAPVAEMSRQRVDQTYLYFRPIARCRYRPRRPRPPQAHCVPIPV